MIDFENEHAKHLECARSEEVSIIFFRRKIWYYLVALL